MKYRLLIVEDDDAAGRALLRELDAEEFEIRWARSLSAARGETPDSFDAVLLEPRLPDGDGTVLLAEWRPAHPQLPFVIYTRAPTLATAVAAVRSGAADYLAKPLPAEALRTVLVHAIEAANLRREVARLREALSTKGLPGGIVGDSEAVRHLREKIRAIAAAPTTVLIQGETGTGKELVARALHAESGRKGRFVAVNCAAVPENLFEAEVFGCKKGSFTGAVADRAGLVAEAEEGTLFLDEAGEMPPAVQPKILRLLAEGEYRPVGDSHARRAKIRLVAATNRDLKSEVEKGRFREDLYWRLAVVTLVVPPLRARREDIPDLSGFFLARASARLGKEITGLSSEALGILAAHDWPGNIRELENLVERTVLFGSGPVIEACEIDLAAAGASPAPDEILPLRLPLDSRESLVDLLKSHDGNVARAARAAGRNRTAFYEVLKRLGVNPMEYRRHAL